MTKMTVEVNKDQYGFPSIVTITKEGKTLRVTTNPDMGFTIEGPRGLLPDVMEAFRVILPRVSYQKEVDVIQAEENTEVSSSVVAYTLMKAMGLQLSESRTGTGIILSFWTDNVAIAAGLKLTYQIEGGAETTWFEETTTSTIPIIIRKTLCAANMINMPVTVRLYLKRAAAGGSSYSKQLTMLGDIMRLMGHVF